MKLYSFLALCCLVGVIIAVTATQTGYMTRAGDLGEAVQACRDDGLYPTYIKSRRWGSYGMIKRVECNPTGVQYEWE